MLAHEIIRKFAEEIIRNYKLDNVEAVLYTEGDFFIRQSGSVWFREDKIMAKIPLGQSYWGESYFWDKDLDEDEDLREIAIEELIEDIHFKIYVWQSQKDKLRKFVKRALSNTDNIKM